MTPQDIVREIKSGSFTNDDLDDMGHAIRFARAQLGKDVRRGLFPGALVYFRSRDGSTVHGKVESIKIKNAVVATTLGRYRVPCNMLTVK
jgi:hypothetical protein